MKKLLAVLLALLLAGNVLAGNGPSSSAPKKGVVTVDVDEKGTPTFLTGDLGSLGGGSAENGSQAYMRANKHLFKAVGTEDFDVKQSHKDDLGQTHVKLQQTINGLPVVGGELIVHSDSSGRVLSINGRFAPDQHLPKKAAIDGRTAVLNAAAQAGIKNWTALSDPVLTYVVTETSAAHLAWMVRASYAKGGPQIDKIYADAITGDLVLTAPEYYYAKSRATYSANNGTTLPGTLRISEGGALTGDAAIDSAHNYAGNVYDFYFNVHARDSYDNAGAQIKSSAHYSTSYNNAFWNGTQMVYGDGDGTSFIPLSEALDVDAHELSHAVTERTANLTYSNESGALNEANSDIQGESCEAYTRNAWTPNANTWMVGEDIYTPGTSGDALRYMDDPAKDGSSSDWYPTRYTGTSDNGGVHTNSGIANLAFYKMVMGGTHPRGKSTVNVTPLSTTPATSMQMASKIQYRALTVYMTSSTNFAGARTATAQAATDLYGAAAATSVNQAWDCVGVPGGTSGFSISASPSSVSVAQGSTGTSTISTSISGSFNSAISLSASGAPAGTTVSFSPTSIAAPGSGSSTMTLSVGAGTTIGTYTITVTGSGGSITHTTSVSLTVTASGGGGALANGGFETGSLSSWTAAGTAAANTASKHSGSYGAQLGSTAATTDSTLAQTFTLPTGSPTLSFWYANTCPDTVTYDWATATVKDNSTGTTTTILAKTCTTTPVWTQVSWNASASAGHSITLTLTNHDDNYAGDPTYTYFDDVTVAGGGGGDTTAPTTSVTAPANGATVSGTVSVTASASDNVGVTKVEFYLDSVLKSTSTTSPYSWSWATTGVANGSHTLLTKAYDAAGNIGTSATITVTVSNSTGSQQLIQNPGFESGTTPWVTTTGVIDSSTGEAAHSGSWKAWMNGYGSAHTDSVQQTVTIPSTATSATLSFWLHIDTAETTTTTAYDTLNVQIRNSSGTVLATLATYSNLNAATGYTQKSFNVLAYKGQTIQVYLVGVEDASAQTSFVVDDFLLNVQ